MFQPQPSYSYDDLGLKPINLSYIESRSDVSTTTKFFDYQLSMPIIGAPMVTISSPRLANKLTQLGGLLVLARTNNIDNDIELYKNCKQAIPSIPATKDYLERLDKFVFLGATTICIDVANGFHINVKEAVRKIKQLYPYMKIITGNIASLEGYKFLKDLGVDAVRVGVSNGSICATAIQTKIGVGQCSIIRELADYKYSVNQLGQGPLIIADGGIKNSGSLALAIALGADIVMSGSIFAGTEESAGDVINNNGQLYKHYAGQASKYIKGNANYVEGADLLVSYKGPVEKIWNNYKNGLQSSMAYMNCENINTFKYLDDECFVYLYEGARLERGITAK